MSPEEWAQKIRNVILEAEEDLDRSHPDGGEYWLVLANDFVIQKYEGNYAVDEYVRVW